MAGGVKGLARAGALVCCALVCCALATPALAADDAVFFENLKTLITAAGPNPLNWPRGRAARQVAEYLRREHGVGLNACEFGLNFLGLGVGENPDIALMMRQNGQCDAWGRPYDQILSSSRMRSSLLNKIFSMGINQGVNLFNPRLTQKVYVFVKADLFSQFNDVFKNFNGMNILFICGQVNHIGGPGSRSPDYAAGLAPALTAADALEANIYLGGLDKVTLIDPEAINETARMFKVELPEPKPPRQALGQPKKVPVRVVELAGVDHDLDQYFAGMRRQGESILKAPLPPGVKARPE